MTADLTEEQNASTLATERLETEQVTLYPRYRETRNGTGYHSNLGQRLETEQVTPQLLSQRDLKQNRQSFTPATERLVT